MARILRLKELELRKRTLVAESEVYRQTLRLEARNFNLYALSLRRKLDVLRWLNPLLTVGAPLVGSLFGARRAPARRGWLGMLLRGWRLYRQFGPVLQSFFTRGASRGGAPAGRPSRAPSP